MYFEWMYRHVCTTCMHVHVQELAEPMWVGNTLMHNGLRVRGSVHVAHVKPDARAITCNDLYLKSKPFELTLQALQMVAKSG